MLYRLVEEIVARDGLRRLVLHHGGQRWELAAVGDKRWSDQAVNRRVAAIIRPVCLLRYDTVVLAWRCEDAFSRSDGRLCRVDGEFRLSDTNATTAQGLFRKRGWGL